MIETHAPRQETLRENTRKPRLFEAIENPEPGWTTRKLESHRTVDSLMEWHVELIREHDGATVNFHHPSLHLAWLRACESAHMQEKNIHEAVDREGLDATYREEQRALKAAAAAVPIDKEK